MTQPTAIVTFSGPGGSSLGYKEAGFNVCLALDCAPEGFTNTILDTYRINNPDTIMFERNAKEIGGMDMIERADIAKGELDLLDGAPPCSPFSSSNVTTDWHENKGATLFDDYIRFVNEIHPKMLIAENVPRLNQGKYKKYFTHIYRSLQNAGYIVRVQKIDAAYLGAPEHRRRLIFMGVRDDLDFSPPKIKPNQEPTEVRDALDQAENTDDDIEEAKGRFKSHNRSELYRQLDQGERLQDAIKDFRDGAYGWDRFRLSETGPARTLTSRSTVIHPTRNRLITIPEFKALLGLPGDWKIASEHYGPSQECIIRCLPPIMMEVISKTMLEKLRNNCNDK